MDYDLAVIGGGAAGLAAARTGAARGGRVVLVSHGPIGGECTFTGCVPSKTLIEQATRGASFDKAIKHVREAVARIAATETSEVLAGEGIDVLAGRAAVTGAAGTIVVAGHQVRARAVVLATGSRPAIPAIRGLADLPYLTNETVFGLTRPPDSLAVLGGGAIGCELAQAFRRLGVEVTVIEAAHRLLPAEDPQASQVIEQVFRREGIRLHLGVTVTDAEDDADGVRLTIGPDRIVEARRLLLATGRRPATGGLDIDTAGVRTDGRGFITTNKRLATSTPGIYAAGDVTGRLPYTHAAYAMGRVAAINALGGRAAFTTDAIPRVTFTDPEVAHVGRAADQAAGRGARIAHLAMSELDRAITADRTDGFIKLIAAPRRLLGHRGGGRLIGATIVAARAGEMIHEPALAIHTRMFTGRLAQTVHAYPTWSIGIQQAAAQFFGVQGGRTAVG